MKYLLLVTTLSFCSLVASYPKFVVEYSNYINSSKCISKLVAQGVARAQIETIGNNCQIK